MLKLEELENDVLYGIVSSIQRFLYVDLDQRDEEYWNPDKPLSYGDLGEHVIGLLGRHDLVPEHKSSLDGSRFILYDIRAEQLVTNTVYRCYATAADDVAGLENVLIVPLTLEQKETQP